MLCRINTLIFYVSPAAQTQVHSIELLPLVTQACYSNLLTPSCACLSMFCLLGLCQLQLHLEHVTACIVRTMSWRTCTNGQMILQGG